MKGSIVPEEERIVGIEIPVVGEEEEDDVSVGVEAVVEGMVRGRSILIIRDCGC